MKIAVFDMDGTITDEVGFLKKYAPNFLRKKYGIEVKEVNANAYSLSDIYDLKSSLIKQTAGSDLQKKCDVINQDFWNSLFIKYCNEPIKEGVRELITSLRESGYVVHIVSMRGKSTKDNLTWQDTFIIKKIIPWLTKRQLRKNKIEVDRIILPSTVEEKINYINASNPQLVFEDQKDIVRRLADMLGEKTQIFCVDNPYNRDLNFPTNVISIKNYEDEKIEEIKNGLNSKVIKVNPEGNFFYRLVKMIGTPFVYGVFKPIVCGRELIPREKSIAFVGNHRKKSDPIIITAIAKQIIHWAALYRMFTGGEALFSDTKSKWQCALSALFLKKMGAVPIARQEDSEYQKINMNTIRFLTDELKNRKASVGFFPEGTLNRKFAEQDILPIKSERIFKMVGISKGYIQPFSIVWIPKNEIIRNRVIICFAAPINSEGRDVADINRMWHESLERNIQKSNNLINKLTEINNYDITKRRKRKQMLEEIHRIKNCW